MEPPRPAQPHIKYVGPLLPEPPLPLPPHLDAIMAGECVPPGILDSA